MKSDQIRSIRLRTLLQLAVNGATEEQLRIRCRQWGVTKNTENSYINAILARLQR